MFHTVSSNPLSFFHLFPADTVDTFLQADRTSHDHPPVLLSKYSTAPVPSHNGVLHPAVHVLLETVSNGSKCLHHIETIPLASVQPPESVSSSLLPLPSLLNAPGSLQFAPVPAHRKFHPGHKLLHNTRLPGNIPLSFPVLLQPPKIPASLQTQSLRFLLKFPHSLSVLLLFPDRNEHVFDPRNIPYEHPFQTHLP